MEKHNRLWLIAAVAALGGIFLGCLCGVVGGGTIGYLLGLRNVGTPEFPQQVRTPVPPSAQPVRTPVPPPTVREIPARPTRTPLPDVPSLAVGALVVEVLPDTPAERAGLQRGDIILAVGGQEVGPGQTLSALIQQHRPGERVLLTVRRNRGETLRIDVQLVESPTNPGRGYLGVRVQDLAP